MFCEKKTVLFTSPIILLLHLQDILPEAHLEFSRTYVVELFCGNNQRIKTVGYNRRRAPLRMFDSILNATLLNNSLHLHQKMVIPRMFPNIPRNISGHSPEWWTTFPEMFGNILRKITFPSFPASPTFRSLFLYSCIHSLQKLKNSFGKHFFKRNRLTRH